MSFSGTPLVSLSVMEVTALPALSVPSSWHPAVVQLASPGAPVLETGAPVLAMESVEPINSADDNAVRESATPIKSSFIVSSIVYK
jgi:hypothetical protein